MKKYLILTMFSVAIFICDNSFATLYHFTINGDDLMSASILTGDHTSDDPYQIGYRKLTVYERNTLIGEYYSDTAHPNFASNFYEDDDGDGEYDWYLVDFTIQGTSDTASQRWGQTTNYNPSNISTPSGWTSTYIPSTKSVKFYITSSNYIDGIQVGGGQGTTFEFVADVSNPTLTIWFGGTLNSQKSLTTPYRWMKYQGAITLQGTPVPEPSTLFLFGFALIGLGTLLFNKRLSK